MYVDPNGNDSTALLGRLDFPWQTINAALNYANTLISSGSYSDINVHVLSGNYSEPGSINLNAGGQITIHLEANTTITHSGQAGVWLNLSGTAVSVVGAGRANSTILTGGAGTQLCRLTTVSSLELRNLTVSSESMNASRLIDNGADCNLLIDNCTLIAGPAGTTSYCYVIINNGNMVSRNSTLVSLSNYIGSSAPLTPGAAINTTDSWIIIENTSNSGARIKLLQTQLVAKGNSTAASHFILTTPSSAGTDSILLDDTYFHTTFRGSESLLNNSVANTDNYYIGGTIISSGSLPNGTWVGQPAGLVGVFDQWMVATIDPT